MNWFGSLLLLFVWSKTNQYRFLTASSRGLRIFCLFLHSNFLSYLFNFHSYYAACFHFLNLSFMLLYYQILNRLGIAVMDWIQFCFLLMILLINRCRYWIFLWSPKKKIVCNCMTTRYLSKIDHTFEGRV